jgi:hypothetical protein
LQVHARGQELNDQRFGRFLRRNGAMLARNAREAAKVPICSSLPEAENWAIGDCDNETVLEVVGEGIEVASVTKWHSELNERLEETGRIETPFFFSRKPEIASLNTFTE